MLGIQQATLKPDSIDILWDNSTQASFPLFWLRDHCREPESFNQNTHQREVETFNLPAIPAVEAVTLADNKQSIRVNWRNEKHASTYSSEFLYAITSDNIARLAARLWNNETLSGNLPIIDYSNLVLKDTEIPLFDTLEQYGLAFMEGVEPSIETTKQLAEQLGYIRETIFGGLWDFSNNMAHGDTAYTNVGIGPHTDGTYSFDPPGFQLLHCLAFDGDGGENMFVDGFKVADLIKQKDPDAFNTLTEVNVPAVYIEDGAYLRAVHPVIRLRDDGSYQQICFNNFDRAPFLLPKEEQEAFYHAYGLFHSIVNDPTMQIFSQLKPGKAVWFDNWRVLHARKPYEGFRHLAGAYINQEDFQSKLHVLREQEK